MVHPIQLLFGAGSVAGLSDAQLLERFAARRGEAAEAAFAALLDRHGPMVLGVCRKLLRNHHDADDAFQATFLVLARKAGTLRRPDLLGPWLYGVALRTARHARDRNERRGRREAEVAMAVSRLAIEGRGESRLADREVAEALQEEIGRLSERYRTVVVLCELQGMTHEEAGRLLGRPAGTVSARLSRAREQLRRRLSVRGMAPAVAAMAAVTASGCAPEIPAGLVESTVRIATRVSVGLSAGVVPCPIAALSRGVLRSMYLTKLKVALAAALLVGIAAGSAAVLAQQGPVRRERLVVGGGPTVDGSSGIYGKLQGSWKVTEVRPSRGGTFERARDLVWEIKGREVITYVNGKEVGRSESAVEAGTDPVAIDLIKSQNEGPKTVERGLLRVKDDQIEVCINRPDGDRPTEFRASDSGPFPAIYVFRRRAPGG